MSRNGNTSVSVADSDQDLLKLADEAFMLDNKRTCMTMIRRIYDQIDRYGTCSPANQQYIKSVKLQSKRRTKKKMIELRVVQGGLD